MLIIIALLLSPLLGVFLSIRLAACWFGWLTLFIGLVWLDDHVTSFNEGGNGFAVLFGNIIFSAFVGVIALGTAITFIRFHMASGRDGEDVGLPAPGQVAVSWQIPVGILTGALFFHWLSNRLAGFQPAVLAHVIVLVIPLICTGLIVVFRRAMPFHANRLIAPLTLLATLSFLTGYAALRGVTASAQVPVFANGLPHCAVTFAGTNRPRIAISALDLSPLVDRAYGRYPLDHRYDLWVVVRQYGRNIAFGGPLEGQSAEMSKEDWLGQSAYTDGANLCDPQRSKGRLPR